MISFSLFTDMFQIQLYEIFLECQLCCFELACQGQNVQRHKRNGMKERHGREQGCLHFPSLQQGLRMFCPILGS